CGQSRASHLLLLTVLLLPLPSAPGRAVAAAEGYGGGVEPVPGGDGQNGGQAGQGDSAAGAGEPTLCPLPSPTLLSGCGVYVLPAGGPWSGAHEWRLSLLCVWTQEQWKATVERSKAESLQRSLEEERQMMTQQLCVQRAELERAKSALLEEQKSVMQKCSEERRKLMAEWAEFHTQQQLRKERMEGDTDRTLQMDSQREGTILSLAKVRQRGPFLWLPALPGRLPGRSCP
ncbi:uncharacterized protein FYW35_005034, partial [Pterocles gutturalis]